jgi:hypothetical protein
MRGFSLLYLREGLRDQMAEWGDPFAFGITANKTTIDTFFEFNVKQGMAASNHSYEEVFAASTLDT